jgi:thymidylate synthase (FAD)
MLNVELLAHTPDCEKIIASAAKLCYSPSEIKGIMEGLNEEKTKKFLDKLMSMGHESPIEHVSFTFGIEGVSRSLTHQLVRHRIASYSQKSQRYVKEGQFEYIIPPTIKDDEVSEYLFKDLMSRTQEVYNTLIANGIPPEDARFVLPNACETKIVCTMNARTLMNFFHHRCCERAQWEIRELATQMLMLVKEVAPTLFKYAGPSCISGKCPEGNMSCGKMTEKKKQFLGE